MEGFNHQIENRKKHENELLTEAFQDISKAVAHKKISQEIFEEGKDTKDAVSQLLRHYGIREKEVPKKLKSLEERLDFLLSSAGVFYRTIRLEEGWQRNAMGVMMSTLKEDGAIITILPWEGGGFYYVNPHTGKRTRIDKKEAEKIGNEGYCFYRALPMRKLRSYDIWNYMRECLTAWDILSFTTVTGIVTLVGLMLPKLCKLLTSTVLDYKSEKLLLAVMLFMACTSVSYILFESMKDILVKRMSTKLTQHLITATMMRVISLPVDFFKNYSTGELNQYLTYMSSICNTAINGFFATGITGLFSMVFLVQVFSFAKPLVVPSLIVTACTLCVSAFAGVTQSAITREQMQMAAKEKGLVYSLIKGIRKIRLAGAEKRAFVNWAHSYAREAELQYDPPAQIKLSKVFTSAISLGGTIAVYVVAVRSKVTVSDYYAFTISYAFLSASLMAMANVATKVATLGPTMELIKPLMEAIPEEGEGLETVTELHGEIELDSVTFRYEADAPVILDDLSVKIPAGQYVAIVGKTGCGKSTLLRLLLGFETPTRGSIYYDKKDSRGLDMRSVRKQIGTVMQDGKLFQGSIYENISIGAPDLSMEQVWEAAEMAGIAEDIRRMPMGMHTIIAGTGGSMSGGQKQRLMIARAVAPKPKILFLDEATSALDNITQKRVSKSLDRLKCTRIVVAHRLSTIRHCDRILVLDGGKIVEDGTYWDLMEKQGYFAELVERQKI